MSDPMTHERAERLVAVRLDQPLPPIDEAALEDHLDGCPDCRALAAAYEADRVALRALPPIEPPRDLWARTSAALEREHARHPRGTNPAPRRWGPVAVLSGGVALVLVIAIVGPGLLAGSGTAPGNVALASGNPQPPASFGPLVTPITVATSEVTWVVTKAPGGLSLVTASVNKVCPTGAEPDCPPLAGVARSLANLPTVPSSLVLSPSNAGQAVAIGPTPNKSGTTLYVMAVPAAPQTSPAASTPPSVAPSSIPVRSPVPSVLPSAGSGTPRPTASELASPTATVPVETASSGPLSPSSAPVLSPPASGTPAPTAAATLAILSNVTLVGDQAAYSPDGQWFAFSARPAGTSTGPDVYIWQSGWPAAQPITTDHGSVFSGWVAGQILVSRAIPVDAQGNPLPSPSNAPSASPAGDASPLPSPSSPAVEDHAPSSSPTVDASSSVSGQAALASPSGPAQLATPAAYLVDPASGVATRIPGLDGWRPVVDPSGTWVAYWSGTLTFDPASGMWLPLKGSLEVASWPLVSTVPDSATGAAAAHPLPLDAGTDWDVRWDRTGEHLGVWVADANNPGLGSLSLLTIDQASGQTSSAPPALLLDTPALRGFALRDGQLVWATPPGQDGTGSRLSVLAWTGANAGKTSVQPLETGALIVVP
jgi:Putative zinc-finger